MARRDDKLQIGEFAKLAGTNLRTLRYYEELGILAPEARSEGGFRLYAQGQLARVKAIKHLQSLGLSLRDIANALRTEEGEEPCNVTERLRPALERQIQLTETKIDGMQQELAKLNEARARLLEVCATCDQTLSLDNCDPCPRDQVPLPEVIRALL